MFRRLFIVGLLAAITACASVEGSPVPLNNANKDLLYGKWVGELKLFRGITGIVHTQYPVTLVIAEASSGKSKYETVSRTGNLIWRLAGGKAILNLDRVDREYTLSRTKDGTLYFQTSWVATVQVRGVIYPQSRSVLLKKQ